MATTAISSMTLGYAIPPHDLEAKQIHIIPGRVASIAVNEYVMSHMCMLTGVSCMQLG